MEKEEQGKEQKKVTIKVCDEEGVEEKTRKGTFEEQVGGTAEGSDRESGDEKGGDSQGNERDRKEE
jgi:hypothetical protein